jgi:hypothetical protein
MNSLLRSKGGSSEDQCQSTTDQVAHHISGLEGHIESVQVLERKVRGISDLVSSLLANHPQSTSCSLPPMLVNTVTQANQLSLPLP